MEATLFDKLLEFGSVFDWISPLIAEVKDHANGPAHTFVIPEAGGWSGREIEAQLRSRGIKTWGLMIGDGMIMITVRLAQAWWAQYLLEQARIPIAYGLLDERPSTTARRSPKKRRSNPLQSLDRWLDELVDFFGL